MFVPDADVEELLSAPRRIAVLGIRTEECSERPAFYIPAFLASQGHTILPVPVVESSAGFFLGQPVYSCLAAVPPPIDIVSVFLRPHSVPRYLEDLIAASPRFVWFQSGYLNTDVATALTRIAIRVVYDCILCRAALRSSQGPYPYPGRPPGHLHSKA